MIGPIARIGDAFRVPTAVGWLVAILAVGAATAVAAIATWLGVLPLVLVVLLGAFATVVSFRWPLVALALFAALVPIEEVGLLEGIGTISRIAGLMFAVTYGIPRLGRLSLGAMPWAGWVYVLWAIFSLAWALSVNAALAEIPTLLQLFVIAVLIADFVVHRPEIVRPVLWVYSLSAAVTAVIGSVAYFTQSVADDRAAALTGQDPAQFAALLLPAFVFGLFELLDGNHRALGGLIAAVTALGVLVSATRGAWVAALIVVVLFVLPRFSLQRRVAAVAAILLMLTAMYQIPGIPDLVSERTGNALSTGGAGRTDIWGVGFTIYGSAPVTGVGYANFPVAYTPEAIRASGATYAGAFVVGRAPHNLIVGTLVELGPIGLLLLALFLGPLVLFRGWGPNATIVQAALASQLVAALFLDVLANRKQVWLLIGLAAGLAYLARLHGERRSIPWRAWLSGRRRSTAGSTFLPGAAGAPTGPRDPLPGQPDAGR